MSAHIAASIPSYWIPAHVRAVVTPTGVVLLDLFRNRYFGLGVADASAMAALAENWTEASTVIQPLDAMPIELAAQKAVALSEAGLTSSTPADKPFAIQKVDRMTPLTCTESGMQRTVPIRISHVVDFARACIWAREAAITDTVLHRLRGEPRQEGCEPPRRGSVKRASSSASFAACGLMRFRRRISACSTRSLS